MSRIELPMTKETYDGLRKQMKYFASKIKDALNKIIGFVKAIWNAVKFCVARARADESKRSKMDQLRKIELRTKSNRIKKKQSKRIMKMVFNN